MTAQPIRVLVVDDSPTMRRRIIGMLRASPLVEVVAQAEDGEDALRKTLELRPDVVTLDLEMPRMDGFTFLRLVMTRQPTPVLVVSGHHEERQVFKALELGAVDFIAKPDDGSFLDLERIQHELLRKVHGVRGLRIEHVARGRAPVASAMPRELAPAERAPGGRLPAAVVIGSSTGGPAALLRIFGELSAPPPFPILVAQHMPEGFTAGFAERISRLTPVPAREARDGEIVEPGCVLVAPGNHQVELEPLLPPRARAGPDVGGEIVSLSPARARAGPDVGGEIVSLPPARGRIRLRERGEEDRYAPCVDRLFASAARVYGDGLLAIVLTGMGDDGREGVLAVKHVGGSVVAESEQTAVIFGMPQQAIRTGCVDVVLPLDAIAHLLRRPEMSVLATRPSSPAAASAGR